MFYKTALGHADGSVCGTSGPATITVPKNPGSFGDEAEGYGWRVYRVSSSSLVIEDCGQIMVEEKTKRSPTKERTGLAARYTKFISWTHGVLLRRLGRKRVVWLVRVDGKGHGVGSGCWRGNFNLVTGLEETWLKDRTRFHGVSSGDDAAASLETVG